MSNREQTLGKLTVWKTQEKHKREQREFVEVNNLWAAQRKFLFDRPHLPIETVRHILSLCRPKGFNLYMERHDRALLAVYHDLCKHYGFEVTPRWWELEPLPVRENQHAKILWDVPIPTDKEIVARRPDVFLQDKGNRWLYLIEMVVAWDSLQVERRAEKLSKYRDLCANLRRQFPGYRLELVPVVIRVLGTVTHHLVGGLGCLPTTAKTESQTEGMQAETEHRCEQ